MSLSSSKQSSQSQLDPQFKEAYLNNLQTAQGTAGNLQARQFADLTPDQQRAFDINRQFADPNSQQMQQLGTAANIATLSGNYQPQNVQAQNIQAQNVQSRDVNAAAAEAAALNRGDIRNVDTGSLATQNLQAYMDPYNQAVTQQGLSELERSRQLQQQNTSAQATAARAFGGSRQGVAEAETNRAYGDLAQKFIAQQNSDAFQNAQKAAELDFARQLQAQQLNQGVDLTTGQLNTQNLQQARLANQAAINQANQFNASNFLQANLANQDANLQAAQANQGANLQAGMANQGAGLQANQQRIGASGLLSNIAGQGQEMGFAGANQLASQGAYQLGFSQQQLDAIRNLPLEQQQIINQALGLNVGGGSGMQSSSSGSSFGASVIK